jgi:hypothetical protein
MTPMTPEDYEKAVLQRFRILWPQPRFVVKHDIQIMGCKTRVIRQVDIGVFEAGKTQPFLIVEAKRHKRAISAGTAGSTIALVQDVRGLPAVMVSTSGFSRAARSHLDAEGIGHYTITLVEAQRLHWIPMIEEAFDVDQEFKEASAYLVEAFRNGGAIPFFDNEIPYEEWLAVSSVASSLFPKSTGKVLKVLAREHWDDSVRFNSSQLLDDADQLDAAEVDALMTVEHDIDVVELLLEMRER